MVLYGCSYKSVSFPLSSVIFHAINTLPALVGSFITVHVALCTVGFPGAFVPPSKSYVICFVASVLVRESMPFAGKFILPPSANVVPIVYEDSGLTLVNFHGKLIFVYVYLSKDGFGFSAFAPLGRVYEVPTRLSS